MLRFESVAKVYEHRRSPVTGLDTVSLQVETGEFIAVVGPSGTGKTTLLVTAGAMLDSTYGKVIAELNSEGKRITMVIYDPNAAGRTSRILRLVESRALSA